MIAWIYAAALLLRQVLRALGWPLLPASFAAGLAAGLAGQMWARQMGEA